VNTLVPSGRDQGDGGAGLGVLVDPLDLHRRRLDGEQHVRLGAEVLDHFRGHLDDRQPLVAPHSGVLEVGGRMPRITLRPL
jgi:hypothetical protein